MYIHVALLVFYIQFEVKGVQVQSIFISYFIG